MALVDLAAQGGQLEDYHLLHAVRADLFRQMGRFTQAADEYRQALALAGTQPERRFLERRLQEVGERASRSTSA